MSIRTRMLILAAIAILPAIIFVFFLNASEKKAKERHQIENLKNAAKLYSEEHSRFVENSKHLLLALSITPQVYSGNLNVCSLYFASLLKKYQRYSNFGVADSHGNVICSAVPTTQRVNIADTQFFKQTIKNHDFAVGEYRISQATGNAVLSFGYPLAHGIVYSSIDISWLNQVTHDLTPDETISTLVLDRSGVVLTSDPDPDKWVGKTFSKGTLLTKMSGSASGVVNDFGFDGIRRVYAFEKVGELPDAPFVVVGIPEETIFKETYKNFIQRISVSIIVAAISFGIAWWAGGILIVKQVEALKKIDTLKNDFISLVSHQIRTPLTSIRWFSEILLTQPKFRLSQKQKGIVKDIHEVSNEVISLVGRFLDVSKIESGKITLSPEKTNIGNVAQDVVKELRSQILEKKIKMTIKVHPKTPKAYFDRRLIKQVMLNLVGNAIKYSHKNGRVNVIIRKKGVNIVFEVRDRGIGIPASDKGKIFQKFSRAKNASSFSPYGAGLGLYLVKLIMEAHKGSVWYKSSQGKATRFFFSLPVGKEVLS